MSWDRAFAIVGGRLRDLDSPGRAVIYAGGRTSNETAFVYRPFARPYVTNNPSDCSNPCHESTRLAAGQVIAGGRSAIA